MGNVLELRYIMYSIIKENQAFRPMSFYLFFNQSLIFLQYLAGCKVPTKEKNKKKVLLMNELMIFYIIDGICNECL